MRFPASKAGMNWMWASTCRGFCRVPETSRNSSVRRTSMMAARLVLSLRCLLPFLFLPLRGALSPIWEFCFFSILSLVCQFVLYFFFSVIITIRMLISYNSHIGSDTMTSVNISAVGVMMADIIIITTMA